MVQSQQENKGIGVPPWMQWLFNAVGLAGIAVILMWVGEIRTKIHDHEKSIEGLPIIRRMERVTVEDSYAALYRANAERIARLEQLMMEDQ